MIVGIGIYPVGALWNFEAVFATRVPCRSKVLLNLPGYLEDCSAEKPPCVQALSSLVPLAQRR